jgi:hypothetical protein
MIGERLVAGGLVHVPEQAVEADVQAGDFGLGDVEAFGRGKLARDVVGKG